MRFVPDLSIATTITSAAYFSIMPSVTIKPTRSLLPVVMHGLDSILVCASLPLVQWLLGQPQTEHTLTCGLLGSLLMFILGEAFGIYRPSRGRSVDFEVALTTAAWTCMMISLVVIGFITGTSSSLSRSVLLLWYVVGGLSLITCHMTTRAIRDILNHRGVGSRRTAIVGLNKLGVEIATNASHATDCGLRVVGFFDDRGVDRQVGLSESLPPFLGSTTELLAKIRRNEIDTVLVTLPMRAEKRIQNLLDQLSNSTVSVYIVPDFFVFELLHSRWTHVGGLPVVSVFESPMYGVDGWLKRFCDLVLSVVGVIMISPLLIACALLVKLTTKGPIFFRQKRYGLDGREILVWKFRSMYTCDNGPVVKQATKNDPRITPIGRILRKTSLDELPQLFNVIDGSMSLVGPRPHATAHNEHFRSLIRGYMMRHKVKPGITGLAQVEGSRGETDTLEKMEARIELDHRYIREWSLWMDIKILFKTFFVVLKQDAY